MSAAILDRTLFWCYHTLMHGMEQRKRALTPFVKRLLPMVLLACFVLSFALSISLIALYAEHEHTAGAADDACAVCVSIHAAEKQLKLLGAGEKVASATLFALFFFALAICFGLFLLKVKSPISLKVRLNN